jgi:ribosomal protein L10
MSKYVKDLVTNHLKGRWDGVQDLLLVDISGLDANRNAALRRDLRGKNISLMVIKNSLARRATEGSALAPAFEGVTGTLAALWGGTDIVALAKEVARVAADKQYAKFAARGGVMGGAALSPQEVEQVSKWPSREEQLSILVGQILSPGAMLASQLTSVGGALASQVKELIDRQGEDAEAGGEAAPAEATA